MLDVIDLNFDYQDKPLLNDINVHLSAGMLLHLKGANGAGKTTLLKLINGLHRPSHGVIRFKGQNIHDDLSLYQQHLCFVGHKAGINPYLSLKENCLFDLHYGAMDKNFIELASIFNLDNYLDSPCGLLSAGQRKQVGLLRLWMTCAPLWLLDEPLVALDQAAISILMAQIITHIQKGGSVIVTSHQKLPLDDIDYQEYQL